MYALLEILDLLVVFFSAYPNDIENHHGRKLLGTTTEETAAPNPTQTEEAKTIWEKIEEFYEDKNNFAMYLVLPCIVLVYGGCAMIYCIAKCRQYFKRKKDRKDKKRLQDDTDDQEYDDDAIRNNNNNERRVSSAVEEKTLHPAKAGVVAAAVHQDRPYSKASVSDVRMEQSETPLPWAIPDDEPYPTKKQPPPARPPPPRHPPANDRLASDNPDDHLTPNKRRPSSNYQEKGRPDSRRQRFDKSDDVPRKVTPRPQPVPLHENPRRHDHARSDPMMSPPPPYESHQHHAMGASVFTVDYSRRGDDIPRKVPARPIYNPNPKVKVISQTRGGGTVSDLEAQAMARHAAQLLRLEDKPGPGQPGYKKPKRLVFVAE